MKISSRNVNTEPQLALNPQVLPFYPRSLLSSSYLVKGADSAGSGDMYDDFARSLEKFCGILDDTGHDCAAADKFCNSRTDSWQCWDVPGGSSAGSQARSSSGSFDTIWTNTPTVHTSHTESGWNCLVSNDSKLVTDESVHLKNCSTSAQEKLHGGSKLLDGIWSPSAEGFNMELCCDGSRSLFELFRHGGDGDRADCATATSKMNPTSDPCSTKYYTPFGSGVSLGGLTHSQPTTESCWNVEPTESRNGVIGKPLQSAATMNKINANKFPTVAKLSDFGTKASPEQLQQLSAATLLGFPCEQQKSADKASVGVQSRCGQQRDTVGHQNVCGSVPKYRAGKSPTPDLVGIPGEGRSSAAEQQEKQLLASQQMFMQELNRLPPDLRKQYVDYMLASHLGLLPAAGRTLPAVPGVYYNVAVGPSAVPVTHMFAPPVVMPLMPAPVVTLQPVAPSSVTKSIIRRTEAANELHVCLEDCYEQFRLLENERKKTEAELARQNPGKSVSSDNSCSLPPVPTNPSRVDRLVIDSLREHAKVTTLVDQMQQLRNMKFTSSVYDAFMRWADTTCRVDACRRDEIANAINRHRTKNASQTEKDKDVLALAAALGELTSDLHHARTTLWCCLQLGSCDLPVAVVDAAKQSSRLNLSVHHYPLPSTAVCHTPFRCRENKPLTGEMDTIDDADICDDDDDDDVFTYVNELVNSRCGSCLLNDPIQQM